MVNSKPLDKMYSEIVVSAAPDSKQEQDYDTEKLDKDLEQDGDLSREMTHLSEAVGR